MSKFAKVTSLISLALNILPCLLYFAGAVGHDAVKWTALIGTVGWFAATPLWMTGEPSVDATLVEI